MAHTAVFIALAAFLLSLVSGGAAAAASEAQLAQQQAAGRRLLALKTGRGGAGALIHSGMDLQEAAAARLCVMQCLQHACISWHKIYMGDASGSQQPASAVPAAAAECMLQCGLPEVDSGCVAQTFQRLLNTSPLQYSCSSSCITGLLLSSCRQCGGAGSSSSCAALQLRAAVAQPECVVDAAVRRRH